MSVLFKNFNLNRQIKNSCRFLTYSFSTNSFYLLILNALPPRKGPPFGSVEPNAVTFHLASARQLATGETDMTLDGELLA